jgi:hypothetical protein
MNTVWRYSWMNEAGTGQQLAYVLDCRLDTAASSSEET